MPLDWIFPLRHRWKYDGTSVERICFPEFGFFCELVVEDMFLVAGLGQRRRWLLGRSRPLLLWRGKIHK